ncbi:hypothetical protein OG895_21100 [Streptomyces sp. NBC_00201]|uniref:hypothetical protein n=1 Tax=unclassified Streptomyces TaxID=2593676 RepID=UPI0022580523|nr:MULTISPECIES: hypothetical protein [unclassified Streptomyces]MCX5055478.1 hypothetical protein [Streptomyces sp. NBC_00452]MCX5247676.1 hypothetical protein [Streptomyces sp. NBC_00201]MCX5286541.1 hypothetical protein [Streptomyces sp. NBC_00183]
MAPGPGSRGLPRSAGERVALDYGTPFRFTGTLHSVTVDLAGELIVDADSEMRMHMARQ